MLNLINIKQHEHTTAIDLAEVHMNRNRNISSSTVPKPDIEPGTTVYCRLFYDVVPMQICTLRQKELKTFGWDTCNGCTVGLMRHWSDCRRP